MPRSLLLFGDYKNVVQDLGTLASRLSNPSSLLLARVELDVVHSVTLRSCTGILRSHLWAEWLLTRQSGGTNINSFYRVSQKKKYFWTHPVQFPPKSLALVPHPIFISVPRLFPMQVCCFTRFKGLEFSKS
jgi:hypothetical protein